MDIDLSVLKSLEAEKDISMDLAIKAIEDALLVAYHRTEGAAPTARVEVNRRSGHVTVWAAETGADGTVVREYDDTPEGFGRIAATTARQVILQRLRDAEAIAGPLLRELGYEVETASPAEQIERDADAGRVAAVRLNTVV